MLNRHGNQTARIINCVENSLYLQFTGGPLYSGDRVFVDAVKSAVANGEFKHIRNVGAKCITQLKSALGIQEKALPRCPVCHRVWHKSTGPNNAERASWAGAALHSHMEVSNGIRDNAVVDLIANLRHYCNAAGINFDEELQKACDL